MKTIFYIAQGLFFYLLYSMRLFPTHLKKVIIQRKQACKDCPLRVGYFCSNKKMAKAMIVERVDKKMIKTYKIVKGCGCLLPLKRFSGSKCPLDKWL